MRMHTYIDSSTLDTTDLEQCKDCGEVDAASLAEVQACMLDSATSKILAGIFRALGDPTRLRIISMLAERELCVRDLTAALEMEQPAVSHQLSDMRELRLVRSRKEGRHVYYRLDDEHVARALPADAGACTPFGTRTTWLGGGADI